VSTLDNPNAHKPLRERVSTQTGVKLPQPKQAAAPIGPEPYRGPVAGDGRVPELSMAAYTTALAFHTKHISCWPAGDNWDAGYLDDLQLTVLRTLLLRALRKVDTAAYDRGLTPSPILTIGG
jgi:hypothetical protein